MNQLNTKSVKKIVLKNTLKTHYSIAALIELIVKQVKEIPDYLKLKQDIELTLIICRMIETICADSEVSIDKLEAIRGVYSQVFEMTTDDHLLLINIVNFLHQNKAFVYKTGAFAARWKVLNWIVKQTVNLGINSASNTMH